MSTLHQSDSSTQRKVEDTIFKQLKNLPEIASRIGSLELKSEGFTISDIKFQVDFYNEETAIFGEVYASTFPLKSGHSRKIKSDILKLITIEKLINKPAYKYLVLTISEKDLKEKNQFPAGSFVAHGSKEGELNFLGQKTWLNETLNLCGFRVFYYVLSDTEREVLDHTRRKQKEGMRGIIS